MCGGKKCMFNMGSEGSAEEDLESGDGGDDGGC